ncbi:MAG: hypothetical protein JWQ69_3051 [Pseudomonas sp.]|nr:hypothetical protein [Pseudomonas sp.]
MLRKGRYDLQRAQESDRFPVDRSLRQLLQKLWLHEFFTIVLKNN